MKRSANTGIIPLPSESGPFMRTPQQPLVPTREGAQQPTSQSWYRIENSAGDNGTAAEVYIYDEIGGWWGVNAQDFAKELLAIDASAINLHLNSPGGAVFDGVAIYNALKMHSAEVTVYVDGLAASAASFIAQAGDKVVMMTGSTMMIHDGMAVAIGNEQDMLDTAAILSKISNNIASIYAGRAGGTVEEWRALMREEVWYTAQEAVDAGLADEVLNTANKEAQQASNRWDLSIFNHAGRADAPAPDEIRQRVFTNKIKESTVGSGPKNTEGGTGDQPATEPVTEQPTPEGGSTEETAPEGTPATETAPVVPESAPAPAPAPAADNKGGQGFVMIGGQKVTDLAAIQAHVNSLEQFRTETMQATRTSFVDKLVADRKVTAPQAEALKTFVADLSAAQYESWTASWNAAPSLSLLENHGSGTSNHQGGTVNKTDRIRDLEDIVAHHRAAGKSEDEIKNMPSYKELQQLRAES